ncbi:MAG TPA: hypothetical protein VN692_17705 [Steroidobacteraceae bacterium]|nr:hypothetical protein [Steroidobacteraceae bacterium]
MAQPLRVLHDRDPREDIREDVGAVTDTIDPLGAGVLIVMYERGKGKGEAKTAGGIILANKTLDEDKYQGKAGLVMKLGPIAFTDDASHQWGDRVPRVGDWVMVNVGDSFAFDLPGDRRARIVEDVNVKAILRHPDMVW